MVLIRRAMNQHMMYRLHTVWLLASWAYAVHSILIGLAPKAAAGRAVLEVSFICLLVLLSLARLTGM